MAKLTQEEILAYLDEATILELNELVKAIEEKYEKCKYYFYEVYYERYKGY